MISKFQIAGLPVYKYEMPIIASNMYMIILGTEALIIDPNANEEVALLLEEKQVENLTIVLTHEHIDHISGVNYFRDKLPCKVYGNHACKEMVTDSSKNLSAFFMAFYISKPEKEWLQAEELFERDYRCTVDEDFSERMSIKFAGLKVELIETPGHSPGSICVIIEDKYIFTGDSLVQGAKTITRLPGGNKKLFKEITMPFLEQLPDDMIVFPGHGVEGMKKLW